MCLGGSQPQAPKIEYVGPSEDEIRRNEESLKRYEDAMAAQAASFQSQLQAQIDQANQDTADLRAQFEEQLNAASAAGDRAVGDARDAAGAATAAAGAAAQAEQVYALTAQQSEAETELAQTTTEIKDKKKKKPSLKISTAGVANQAGSGVNLGI